MSEVELEKITDRAGTGAPDFTYGLNVQGVDSGISPFTHKEIKNWVSVENSVI